ncbi:SMC protein-like protein [Sarcoptes scabiei]|uniref:Structural maintenance of chromosomes protein 5 n=1 Tax=Sarcoptes scabiei TaxID=52283 RepID=A0A131ZTD0_SARSC|nr:SMC protein-like protein [Sarcoptes scabiei]
MGFGGDPQITGRSSNLVDYIRFDANSALITIEIYSDKSGQKNHIIQREIKATKKNNKTECTSNWILNGKLVNKTVINDFIKEINIDVNNLCQVLPQERVVEFSKLMPKHLLLSTEKSIGDVNLYRQHMNLISLGEDVSRLESEIRKNKAFASKFHDITANIEPDLKLIEQKTKFEEEIDWLQKKQVWLEFEEKRTHYIDLRTEFQQRKNDFERFQTEISPLKFKIDILEKCFERFRKDKTQSILSMKSNHNQLMEVYKNYDALQDSLNQIIGSFTEKLAEYKQSAQRLSQYEQDYQNYKNELDNFSDLNRFDSQISAFRAEISQIENDLKRNILEISNAKNQLDSLNNEKRYFESRKKSIKDLFKARMDKINGKDSHTQTAWDWLQNNMGKFCGKIFPPLITQINVIRTEWVNYVEAAIGSLDMSTFLFENINDLELFTEEIKREFNFRVNVAMIPSEIPDTNESFDLERYRHYGIFSKVSDLFTAPEQIMSYLIKGYNLNQIPVGNQITEDRINELIQISSFRKIITNRNIYTIVVSVHDNEKTTRITALSQSKYLNIIIDEKEIQNIDDNLMNIKESIEKISFDLKGKEELMDQMKESRSSKSTELNSIQAKRMAISKIQMKIQEKERQIKSIKESINSVDRLKQEISSDLDQIHRKQLKLLLNSSDSIRNCLKYHRPIFCNEIKMKIINSVRTKVENEYLLQRQKEKSMGAVLKELNEKLNEVKQEARLYREKAKKESGFDYNSDSESQIIEKFNALPATIDEIANQISVNKMRCAGIKNVDADLLVKYQKFQEEIKEKTAICDRLESELNAKKSEINSLRSVWLNSLEEFIEKINMNFKNFMEYLKYSGEVYLSGDKEYAFEDYGIRIRVKFRDSEPMQDLDAYHQSGGERSVATMVYMLSLQELAHVPFRVVDEINQGMDEKNERCVFDLISQVSRRNSSQYFLLSPKLLTNLNYTKEMKIHIIFNGSHNFVDWTMVLKNLLKD